MRKSLQWERSRASQLLAILLVFLLAMPQELPARVKPSSGFNLFSPQDEVSEGQKAAHDVGKQLPLLSDNDPITRYVQKLGANLTAHAPGEKWPYNFHVVNQKEINAFALPGGPIFVNMGTIQAADSEAQLAGVMAHEISHVVQRHGTRAATKQIVAQAPIGLLGGLLGNGVGGKLAQLGIGFGVGSIFLKNSRTAESEADLLGTDIMYDSGYDPNGMAQFFKKLEQSGGKSAPQFLSDHPNPGNRYAAVSKEIATLTPKKYLADSSDFKNAKALAAKAKPLTAKEIEARAKQGGGTSGGTGGGSGSGNGLPDEIEPSANLKGYEGAGYTIQHPENWEVFEGSQGGVTIAPRAGVSENAVAYGVIIDSYSPEKGASLDRGTEALIAALQKDNPDLKMVGRIEDIRVNGVGAKSADFVNVSPLQGQDGKAMRERDWLVALPDRSGNLRFLMFVTTDRDSNALRPTFENMLRSLKLR